MSDGSCGLGPDVEDAGGMTYRVLNLSTPDEVLVIYPAHCGWFEGERRISSTPGAREGWVVCRWYGGRLLVVDLA